MRILKFIGILSISIEANNAANYQEDLSGSYSNICNTVSTYSVGLKNGGMAIHVSRSHNAFYDLTVGSIVYDINLDALNIRAGISGGSKNSAYFIGASISI